MDYFNQYLCLKEKNVSAIEGKVLTMYASGMSQRDISDITDAILPELEEWKDRPLQKCYPSLFVDCMYLLNKIMK